MVAIALVAIRNDDPVSPADQPSPTVTVPVTVPPRALFGTPGEQFVPGDLLSSTRSKAPDTADLRHPRRRVDELGDWLIGIDVGGAMTFSRPDRCSSDACHASEGFHPGP